MKGAGSITVWIADRGLAKKISAENKELAEKIILDKFLGSWDTCSCSRDTNLKPSG